MRRRVPRAAQFQEVRMPKHKFAAGDRVVAAVNRPNENIRPGVYTIVKTMPFAGRGFQYRAKNALDGHERVLDEDLLRPANG
jgi:hypothetical protein